MADLPGKSTPESTEYEIRGAGMSGGFTDRPRGWKYKSFFGLPYYASPQFQLVLVAFVCFLCPGRYMQDIWLTLHNVND